MPIYEYKCKKCNHKFEELVFGNKKMKCPKCGSDDLKKLIPTFLVGKNLGDSSGNRKNKVFSSNCPICKE